jgi:hypothetical protein
MDRAALEHVLRAAAAIADEREFVVAGRERDLEFLEVLMRERMVDPALLGHRLDMLGLPDDRMEVLRRRLLLVGSRQTYGNQA